MDEDRIKVAFGIYAEALRTCRARLDEAGVTLEERVHGFFLAGYLLGRERSTSHQLQVWILQAMVDALAADNPDAPIQGWRQPGRKH